MKTIELKIYSFNELSEEAKQKAIEAYRNNPNREYLYFFQDYCNEVLTQKGFEDTELSYSLSYSQGDGLSFKASKYTKLTDIFIGILGENKAKTAKLLADNCTQIIKGNGRRYCYASRNDIDLYLENYTSSINVTNTNNIDAVIEKARVILEDIYLNTCKELEREGYNQIDEENSDEYIIDAITANEYEFTEDGQRY